MRKAISMAKVSARGGFYLLWGSIISTILSIISGIIIARLLGPAEYGLVAIAMIGPTLIMLFRDWGVNAAIIKFSAQYREEKKVTNLKSILNAGFLFELILGFSLFLLSLLLSGFFAFIFRRPELDALIKITSLTIFSGGILLAAQSTFLGFERMELYSSTIICQSITKLIIGPVLVVLGYGALGAIFGIAASSLFSGVFAIIVFYLLIYKKVEMKEQNLHIIKSIKNLFEYGLPLSISTILLGVLLQFYAFQMAIYCQDLLIGNYYVAANFTGLFAFLTIPISQVLFPTFPKIDPLKENETLQNVFMYSVKYTALLIAPVVTAVIVLSRPIVFTLFGGSYFYAPLFLALYALNYLLPVFGSISVDNILKGQGKTKINLMMTLITFFFGSLLSLFLIPLFGIIGLIITNIFHSIPSLVIGLLWINKHFKVSINWSSIGKILFASVISALVVLVVNLFLIHSSLVNLIIGASTFLLFYILMVPVVGAINRVDVHNLREIFRGFGKLSFLFNFILNFIEKLAK